MPISEPSVSKPALFICEPFAPTRDTAREAAWLGAVIQGDQAPHFVHSDQAASDDWRHMHAGNLLEKLDQNTKVRLFITPTGVLGYYNTSMVQVSVRGGRPWGRVIDPSVLPQGAEIELPHMQLGGSMSLGGYSAILQHKRASDFVFNASERTYMRTVGDVLPQVAPLMPHGIPVDAASCAHVSLYVSQAGTVTNLHWDVYSGVIHQLRGRKRVIFFSPDQLDHFAMHPNRHIFARRAQVADKLTEATLQAHPEMQRARGYECIIEPDQWLYIPARWLHHVETLDDNTISLITRFTR